METFAIRNLSFFYPEQENSAVTGLTLGVRRGEFLVLCGPSGCGKTTLLRQLKSVLAPHGRRSGEILFEGTPLDELDQRTQSQKIGFVRQSPENQIVTDKVWHELAFGLESLGFDTPTIRRRVAEMASFFGIQGWFYKNVTELSGGQKQLLNLASVMAMRPSVLIMDEPTKGLDAEFKQTFAGILRFLLKRGVTVVMVSHDVEFCARYAHRCALFFDGCIVTDGEPREFFSGNSFYTTSANRMARGLLPQAVTAEDVIAVCGGALPAGPGLPEDIPPLPKPKPETADWKLKKLPWWRKLGAVVSGAAAFVMFLDFMGTVDLSEIVSAMGITARGRTMLPQYFAFCAALFVFAACVSRRHYRPGFLRQTPVEKRKLTKRTAAAALILLLIPVTLFASVYYRRGKSIILSPF